MTFQVFIMILFIEVIVSFALFKNDIISPAFIFSIVFFAAAVNLETMVEYWKVTLSSITVIAVTGGVAMFIVGCLLVQVIKIGGDTLVNKKNSVVTELRTISINKNFVICIVIFYIIVEAYMLYTVRSIALAYGGGGSIFQLIGYFNTIMKEGVVSFSVIVNQLIGICLYLGYVWAFILVNNYLVNKKIDKPILLLYLLSCLCGLITGSRGDMITLFFCTAIMYVIIVRKKNRDKIFKIPMKGLIIAVIGAVIILYSFQNLGSFLGRDSNLYESNEYISIYLGGPLLNFNNCIIKGMQEPVVWGHETFMSFYNNFPVDFLLPNGEPLKTSRVYYQANYHNTGNVCTTFYDFYHDFGLIGCFVLCFLMGIFVQFIYNRAKARVAKNSGISVMTIFYSYILFLTARMFFANALINYLFSGTMFLKMIIIWIVAKLLFERIHVKI